MAVFIRYQSSPPITAVSQVILKFLQKGIEADNFGRADNRKILGIKEIDLPFPFKILIDRVSILF